MGFNRGHFFSSLAGLIVGVMLVAVLPAGADNGDPIYLGQANTAKSTTRISVNYGMVIRSFRADVPAATFKVSSGAPIAVNSTTKVSQLNADYVDGRHARELRTTWDWASNDNIATNAEWAAGRAATVPAGGGVILMSGSVDFYNNGTSADLIECFFSIDGTQIGPSRMTVAVQAKQETTCHTDAASEQPAGTYNVKFETAGLADPDLWAEDGFWYFTALPN